MTQPILNPVNLQSLLPLLPAEQRFARCLGEGKPCEVGNGKLPDLQKPIEIESGDAANVVRGEVIRFFAYGGDGKNPVRGSVIDLQGAWISGDLDLTHANIPYALFFGHCHFADSVVMQHAECAALNLGGSHLAKGLQADGLTTKGGVYLRKGFSAHDEDLCEGFSADDEVRLSGASIGGQLDCVGGEFHNPKGFALVVEHAKIGEGLHWRRIKGEGVVNLSSAKAGVLADDLDSWKPFKVILDGFTYDQIVGPTDADSRLKWLANRPRKLPDGTPLSFSPLPYEQAAKVLFGMGHDNDAWQILLEKERIRMRREKESGGTFSPVAHEAAANVLFAMGRGREARDTLWEKEDLLTKRGDFPRWWRVGRRVWDFLAGYGYRPWKRTFARSLAVILFGAAVFAFADHHGNIVPAHPVVMVNEDYKGKIAPAGDMRPTRAAPDAIPEYPEFNALVFSLDVFTPSAVFHQEESWAPRSENKSWRMSLSLLLIVASATLALCLLWLAALGLLCLVPALARHWESLWRRGVGVFLTAGLLAFFSAEATWWYWIEIAAGWILVPLFLLSVTGVLRPRQSSGEKG